jgi:hypothetical protein
MEWARPKGSLTGTIRHPSSTTSKSLADTTAPGFTSTSFTFASRGQYTAVSIFIASIDSNRSPAFTACPFTAATVET